jgi:hypothetical protein
VLGRIAAAHADGQGLGNRFRVRQQVRNRWERAAQVVRVQPGDGASLCRTILVDRVPGMG